MLVVVKIVIFCITKDRVRQINVANITLIIIVAGLAAFDGAW